MHKHILSILALCITAISTNAVACVCFSDARQGMERSQFVARVYVESVTGGRARLKVIKVYKGFLNQEEDSIDLFFTSSNGMNCGTSFTQGDYETIAADAYLSPDGSKLSFGMPECSYDGVRNVSYSQPMADSYLLEIKSLEKAATNHPTQESTWLKYLKKLEDSKDYLRALRVLDHLQKLKPSNQDYLAKSAYIKMRMGTVEPSLASFNQILEIDKSNTLALKGRMQSLIYLNQSAQTSMNLNDYSDMVFFRVNYSNQLIKNADFFNVQMWGDVKFENSQFIKVQFKNSDINEHFKNANFKQIKVDTTTFSGDFSESTWENAVFKASKIYGKFTNAKFKNVDFGNSYLGSHDFVGVSLTNVNLSQANLENVKLNQITCDKTTKWPANFDFVKNGVSCQ